MRYSNVIVVNIKLLALFGFYLEIVVSLRY